VFAVATGTVVLSSMVFIPFRVREMGVNSPTLMSIALTASVLTNIVSSAIYGPIRRYISVEQSNLVTFAFCALGAFIMALSPTYWGLIAGALIFGCGMGGAAATLLTVAAGSVSLERRGRAVGAVKGAFLSGNFVAVLVYEPFSKIWGAWASLFAIGAFSTVMLVYCLLRYGVLKKPRLEPAE
jgi:MFS family permease